MQFAIVSIGDNMYEMPKPLFWEKNKNNVIDLSSDEYVCPENCKGKIVWRLIIVMVAKNRILLK